MWLVRLYARVLGQLGSDRGWAASWHSPTSLLAIAAFAEPILFGRIIDVLTTAQAPAARP